jgi:hypothetical protein
MDEKRLHLLLLNVVRKDTSAGLRLIDSLKELDNIVANHSAELNPQMLHYLQKRSYEKALIQIETGETCGHHRG